MLLRIDYLRYRKTGTVKMFNDRTRYHPTSAQVRAARAYLGLNQEQAAKGSGIALSALKKYESLDDNEFPLVHLRYQTVSKMINFYEFHGLKFLGDDKCVTIQAIKTL